MYSNFVAESLVNPINGIASRLYVVSRFLLCFSFMEKTDGFLWDKNRCLYIDYRFQAFCVVMI